MSANGCSQYSTTRLVTKPVSHDGGGSAHQTGRTAPMNSPSMNAQRPTHLSASGSHLCFGDLVAWPSFGSIGVSQIFPNTRTIPMFQGLNPALTWIPEEILIYQGRLQQPYLKRLGSNYEHLPRRQQFSFMSQRNLPMKMALMSMLGHCLIPVANHQQAQSSELSHFKTRTCKYVR